MDSFKVGGAENIFRVKESFGSMGKRNQRSNTNFQPPPKDVAEALYNAFYESTVRQTLAVVGDKDLAIEATQEAFVRAFEQFGTLRDRDKFSSWVLTDQKTTEEIILARETNDSLVASFESLPEKLKEVALLFYMHDMKVADLARQLHLNQGTVKSRLHRARKILRETLEADIPIEDYRVETKKV